MIWVDWSLFQGSKEFGALVLPTSSVKILYGELCMFLYCTLWSRFEISWIMMALIELVDCSLSMMQVITPLQELEWKQISFIAQVLWIISKLVKLWALPYFNFYIRKNSKCGVIWRALIILLILVSGQES